MTLTIQLVILSKNLVSNLLIHFDILATQKDLKRFLVDSIKTAFPNDPGKTFSFYESKDAAKILEIKSK